LNLEEIDPQMTQMSQMKLDYDNIRVVRVSVCDAFFRSAEGMSASMNWRRGG